MTEKDKSFVIKLFACCVAFAFVFMIIAIVGGFIAARLLGLPVDVDRFYNTIGPAFTMVLAAAIGIISVGGKPSARPPDDESNR